MSASFQISSKLEFQQQNEENVLTNYTKQRSQNDEDPSFCVRCVVYILMSGFSILLI